MEKTGSLEAYFQKEGPFREGLARLREVLLETGLEEHLKWGAPVYALDGVNVLGLMAFKKHYGLWFFQGVFLSDPYGVLSNAQEGKTKAMRHWKFTSADQPDLKKVKAYVQEAISLARKGVKLAPASPRNLNIPEFLQAELGADPELRARFEALALHKQRDFAEYIATAKQQTTRMRRWEKIMPMIRQGVGLNDQYRKS